MKTFREWIVCPVLVRIREGMPVDDLMRLKGQLFLESNFSVQSELL